MYVPAEPRFSKKVSAGDENSYVISLSRCEKKKSLMFEHMGIL